MSEEEKTAKILQIFKEGSTPSRPRRRTAAKPIQITVNGKVTGQIAGGDIHNHSYTKGPRPPSITVTPGDGVISEAQKVALTALRDEWITLHNSIKKKPLSYGAAWARINSAAGATSYHLIRLDRFDAAVAYIKKQMVLLRGMRSAPAKDAKWRASRIGAIKLRCANQLGDPDAYRPYIKKNFKLDSLAALSTDQLERTYRYIMGKSAKPG